MDIPKQDGNESPKRAHTDILENGFVKEDTFVIPSAETPVQSAHVSQDLKHRKALALAKANARHVIRSWQKRHQILENGDVTKRSSGRSRPYIQNISDAVHNDNGERIYFRWEESAKISNARQPKAVSKLYAYKRKRNGKKKTGLGDPSSKSAPNRGAQDSSTSKLIDSSDLRVNTAATDHNGCVDLDTDNGLTPQVTQPLAKPQNQNKTTKRVGFELPPHRYRGVKEAFLSNSAKSQNAETSRNGSVRSKQKTSHLQSDSLKIPSSDSDKITSDGQTDSDKENALALDSQQQENQQTVRTVFTKRSDEKIGKSGSTEPRPEEQLKMTRKSNKSSTEGGGIFTQPQPVGMKPSSGNTKETTVTRIESKSTTAMPPSSKSIIISERNMASHHQDNLKTEKSSKRNSLPSNQLNDFNAKTPQDNDLQNSDKRLNSDVTAARVVQTDVIPNSKKSASKSNDKSQHLDSLSKPQHTNRRDSLGKGHNKQNYSHVQDTGSNKREEDKSINRNNSSATSQSEANKQNHSTVSQSKVVKRNHSTVSSQSNAEKQNPASSSSSSSAAAKLSSKQNTEKEVNAKTSKGNNSKRPFYRQPETRSDGDVTSNSITASSRHSKPHYDKSDYKSDYGAEPKRDAVGVDRGHLNTIIESLSEPNAIWDRHQRGNSIVLLTASDGGVNDAYEKEDITANGGLLFNSTTNKYDGTQQTNFNNHRAGTIRGGVKAGNGKSNNNNNGGGLVSNKKSTRNDADADVVAFDNRLSVSWPKTRKKSIHSGKGGGRMMLARSDEEKKAGDDDDDDDDNDHHRHLNLNNTCTGIMLSGAGTATVVYSDDADSPPPLSINRNHPHHNHHHHHHQQQQQQQQKQLNNYHGGEKERRGLARILNTKEAVRQTHRLSLSRKESIDNISAHSDKRSNDEVKRKVAAGQISSFLSNDQFADSGERRRGRRGDDEYSTEKQPGDDDKINASSNDKILLSGHQRLGFQSGDKVDGQIALKITGSRRHHHPQQQQQQTIRDNLQQPVGGCGGVDDDDEVSGSGGDNSRITNVISKGDGRSTKIVNSHSLGDEELKYVNSGVVVVEQVNKKSDDLIRDTTTVTTTTTTKTTEVKNDFNPKNGHSHSTSDGSNFPTEKRAKDDGKNAMFTLSDTNVEKGIYGPNDNVDENNDDGDSVEIVAKNNNIKTYNMRMMTHQEEEDDVFSRSLSHRPVSAGMSVYLDRPSLWRDENESAHDDEIKFINDEKDFYDVFGYDAETTEILRSTRIFPVANFQDSGPGHASSNDKSIQKKLNPKPAGGGGGGGGGGGVGSISGAGMDPKQQKYTAGRLGQTKLKHQSKGSSGGVAMRTADNGKGGVATNNYKEPSQIMGKSSSNVATQEEMRLKAREKLLSLALRTESDDSLYRNAPPPNENTTKQFAKKISSQNETAVLISTSSSSPSSSLTSQSGVPLPKKGDSLQPKIGQNTNGFSNDKEKPHRRFRKKSLDGVKVDVRVFPKEDLFPPDQRAPRPLPSYQVDPLTAPELSPQQPPGTTNIASHHHQFRPLLPPKQAPSKNGYLQRRRIFSESETDRKKEGHLLTPLKLVQPHEPSSRSLAKDNVVLAGQSTAPLSKSDHTLQPPLSYAKHGGVGGGASHQDHQQRGFTDVGSQFRKHNSNNNSTVDGGGGVSRVSNAHTLPLNYTETKGKVKARLLEQPSQRLLHQVNGIGLNKPIATTTAPTSTTNNINNTSSNNNSNNNNTNNTTTNNNNNNSSNSSNNVPYQLNHHQHHDNNNPQIAPRQLQQPLAPRADTDGHPGKALSNRALCDNNIGTTNTSTVVPANLPEHISQAKPRKLKPIIHHPGMTKRQHLASGGGL